MSSDLYDIFLLVPSHGIHNPQHLHSFRPFVSMIPARCAVCKSVVFPFSSAAACIRCEIYIHRICVSDLRSVCEKFLLGPIKLSKFKSSCANKKEDISGTICWGVDGDIVALSQNKMEKKAYAKVQVPQNVITNVSDKFQIQGITTPHVHGGDMIPSPGSKDCIWRRALMLIGKKFNLTHRALLPVEPGELEVFILSMLSNDSTFPGYTSKILRAIYVEMNFPSNLEKLSHARECLDNISSSILTIISENVIDDKDKLITIVNIVDRKMLALNDFAMYDKVWSAAKRLEGKSDYDLKIKMSSLRTYLSSSHRKSCLQNSLPTADVFDDESLRNVYVPEYITPGAVEELSLQYMEAVGSALTAIDKLSFLVQGLKIMATKLQSGDKGNHGTAQMEAPSAQRLAVDDTSLRDVDADMLLQRLVSMLLLYEREEDKEEEQLGDFERWPPSGEAPAEGVPGREGSVDTATAERRSGSLTSVVGGTVSMSSAMDNCSTRDFQPTLTEPSPGHSGKSRRHRMKLKPLFWLAECTFIASMCRENDWLLGAEGYAMVTLQQALLFLNSHRCLGGGSDGNGEPEVSTSSAGICEWSGDSPGRNRVGGGRLSHKGASGEEGWRQSVVADQVVVAGGSEGRSPSALAAQGDVISMAESPFKAPLVPGRVALNSE